MGLASCSSDDDTVIAGTGNTGNAGENGSYNDLTGLTFAPARAAELNVETIDGPANLPDEAVAVLGSSVEVNLAMNEDHGYGDWKEAHLSIHVRQAGDVTVTIPTAAQYYISSDVSVVLKANNYNVAAANIREQVAVKDTVIAGNTVTLTVTYGAENITVEAKGITEGLLAKMQEEHKDLTFEALIGYGETFTGADGEEVELTRDMLQAMLNNTTIAFSDAPEHFVNAFGYMVDEKGEVIPGVVSPLNCSVKPADAASFTPREGTVDAGYGALYVFGLNVEE